MNKNDRDLLPIGTLLRNGTYRVERYLGSGGFGKTYLVRHQGLDAEMVVKEFFMKGINTRDEGNTVTVSVPDNRATFESQRAKFKKEAQRLWKLKGDHIVGVHDIFEENGTVYYVMDFIDGESLEDRLKREKVPLPENVVNDILDQLLDALATIHHHQPQPIFHLDIKPSNILLGRDGKVVLIDFGASKQLSGTREGVTSTLITYTKGYAPSEQVDGKLEHIGAWTDLYAVGATIYRLLTMQQPPEPSDIINEGEDAFLFPENVSARIRGLIVWMMLPNRKQRPQTVEKVHAFLAKEAFHKAENRKEHAFAPRSSTNFMFIEFCAESYVGQRETNGSFVTCICLKKNEQFVTSNNIFITEKGCYLVTFSSRQYQHFLTTIKGLKLRVLENPIRIHAANTGNAPAKLRITLYDEKIVLSDELWLDGINNGNIVGDIHAIKERIVKVVSGLDSYLNSSYYVSPKSWGTDCLEDVLRFLENEPQTETPNSFVDGVPILYDDTDWGEYVIETGESEYGTSGLLKRKVKGHIPIPDSIVISLTPNAGYNGQSYEIVLKQKGMGKVLIAQNEDHAETVITGIPDDVMDYFIRNGFFSPIHWEIENKTSAPGLFSVSCDFHYHDGTRYLRSCNTTLNHVLLLNLINNLFKETSLSNLIEATIKLIHPIDVDSDSNDTIPVEIKYRLPLGYILKAHGRSFRIVGFIAENDYSITYKAIEVHEETQFNTGDIDTVPLQQFTIIEYFCKGRDQRLEDGITSSNNSCWEDREHSQFLDYVRNLSNLPIIQVCEFYGDEYGLSWQFVKANGTEYYVFEKGLEPSVWKKIRLWVEENPKKSNLAFFPFVFCIFIYQINFIFDKLERCCCFPYFFDDYLWFAILLFNLAISFVVSKEKRLQFPHWRRSLWDKFFYVYLSLAFSFYLLNINIIPETYVNADQPHVVWFVLSIINCLLFIISYKITFVIPRFYVRLIASGFVVILALLPVTVVLQKRFWQQIQGERPEWIFSGLYGKVYIYHPTWHHNHIPYMKNGKWGIALNGKKENLKNPIFDDIDVLDYANSSFYKASKNGQYCVLDTLGTIVYDEIKRANKDSYYYDKDSVKYLRPIYKVEKDGKWGLIDSYHEILEPKYDGISISDTPECEHYYKVRNSFYVNEGQLGVINDEGEIILPISYDFIEISEHKLWIVGKHMGYGRFKYGLVYHSSGEMKYDYAYDSIDVKDGCYVLNLGGKELIVDMETGKSVTPGFLRGKFSHRPQDSITGSELPLMPENLLKK